MSPEQRAERIVPPSDHIPPSVAATLRKQIAAAIRVAVEIEVVRCAARAEQAAIQTQGDPRAIYERVLGTA